MPDSHKTLRPVHVVEFPEEEQAPPPHPRPSRRRSVLRALAMLGLAAAVIAVGIAGQRWLVATRVPVQRQPLAERPKPVDAATVTVGTVRPMLLAYGQLVPGRGIDLRMHVAGEVVAVAPGFAEGGLVTAGQMLVTVDPFDHEGALIKARSDLAETEARIAETRARIQAERDALARAEEQRDISQRDLERMTDLSRRGTASTADLDASRLRVAQAVALAESRRNQIPVLEAQLARETASLDRLRWAVRDAERDVEHTRLTAPFSGTLSNVSAEVGRILNVNDRVATLVDLDRLDVRFSLTDGQYGRFVAQGEPLEGRPVTVMWRGGDTVVERRAVIERIAPSITASAGGVDVFARLDPADGPRILRPGLFVEARLPGVPLAGVARVPQAAVHPGNILYRIGPDDRLIPVAVDIAGYDGDSMLVRGRARDDLPDGARILAMRLSEAGPGVLVTAKDAPAAKAAP